MAPRQKRTADAIYHPANLSSEWPPRIGAGGWRLRRRNFAKHRDHFHNFHVSPDGILVPVIVVRLPLPSAQTGPIRNIGISMSGDLSESAADVCRGRRWSLAWRPLTSNLSGCLSARTMMNQWHWWSRSSAAAAALVTKQLCRWASWWWIRLRSVWRIHLCRCRCRCRSGDSIEPSAAKLEAQLCLLLVSSCRDCLCCCCCRNSCLLFGEFG